MHVLITYFFPLWKMLLARMHLSLVFPIPWNVSIIERSARRVRTLHTIMQQRGHFFFFYWEGDFLSLHKTWVLLSFELKSSSGKKCFMLIIVNSIKRGNSLHLHGKFYPKISKWVLMLVVEISENLRVCMTLAVLKILTDCNKWIHNYWSTKLPLLTQKIT